MADEQKRNRQIDAKIANANDMVDMFRDIDRLRNSDFAFKWHRFPTTKEELQDTLIAIGADGKSETNIIVNDYDTVIYELNDRLPRFANLDELNYLAVKMAGLTEAEHNIFRFVIESGRHCESMKDIINITENLACFDLQPAYSAEMYGEFHATMYRDYFANAFETLEKSPDPYMREFAAHINKLDDHLNSESYGRALAEQENGVFTEQGLLTESEGFREVYRGPEDIPAEYRVSALPEREPAARPSVMDKLASAKEAAGKANAEKSDKPQKSHDAEL